MLLEQAVRGRCRDRGRARRGGAHDRDALPERGGDPGGLRRARRWRHWRRPASWARCWSPTMAAPTARRRWRWPPGRGWSTSPTRGYGNALAGRDRRGARPVRPDGRRRRLLRLRRAAAVPGARCAVVRIWSWAAACRRAAGRILPGAMPWKHRWIGNPILTRPGPPVLHRTRSTTSIAACAPSGAMPSWGWGCSARAWSSPRRWWCGRRFAGLALAEVPVTLRPRRPLAPAAPAQLARRLAPPALHAAVLAALAVPDPGADPGAGEPRGLPAPAGRAGAAGRRDLRRQHADPGVGRPGRRACRRCCSACSPRPRPCSRASRRRPRCSRGCSACGRSSSASSPAGCCCCSV